MILFKRNTTSRSWVLIAIVRILQPNYFILQPLKQSLLCFYSTWTERVSAMLFPRRKASRSWSYSNSMVQSKVKVQKKLSQPRDIWEIVFCSDIISVELFIVWLQLAAVKTQITAAKQTWLAIHSSKTIVESYESGPMTIQLWRDCWV